MKNELKKEMRTRAQMIRGLINLLKDDADYICSDTDDFDLIGLGESIREAKETVQTLIDHIMELEYSLYLTKNEESR
jgi:hypothetical protein